MSLEIKKSQDSTRKYWHVLLYGAPKSGKSTMAATMPLPLVLSFDEGGMQSLRHKAIDFVEPSSFTEVLSVLAAVGSTLKDGTFTFQDTPYRSLVIDPLNRVEELIQQSVMAMGNKTKLSLPDRGLSNDKFVVFMRQVCRLDVHVLMTCLERMEKDEHTGRVKGGLSLSPALMRNIPAIPDFIWHSVVEAAGGGKVKYTVSTQAESYYEGGGRYADKPPLLREPADFDAIYKKVMT